MHVDRRSFVRTLAYSGCCAWPLGDLLARATSGPPAERPIRVTVWCEGSTSSSVYPDDIDGAIADQLSRVPGLTVSRGRLGQARSGLSDQELDATDVLIWWGRVRHDEVPDDRAFAVVERIREGRLGFIALYASRGSKPFRQMMTMPCEPGSWREDGRPEFVSIRAPEHPIAVGITPFTIPKTDMFSEPLAVPEPETIVFVSTWERGETLRSGLTWTVGKGRVVYLHTGPENYPVLYHPSIKQAIVNSVLWTAHRT